MILQRNSGQFIRSPPIVRKIYRKIKLVFHYFVYIEKNTGQLFWMGDIENINQAIDIYKKYDKKLLSKFYLLIKFFWEINIPQQENIKLVIQNTKKPLQFLPGLKNLDRKKKFSKKSKKKKNFFFDQNFFFFWWEIFFFFWKKFPNKKIFTC